MLYIAFILVKVRKIFLFLLLILVSYIPFFSFPVNLVVKHDLIGEPVEKDGLIYMHLRDYKVRFFPERVLLNFSNLFNGDKALGDNMNA